MCGQRHIWLNQINSVNSYRNSQTWNTKTKTHLCVTACKPSIPSMILQTCKAPYPTFIIISESWGSPSVHPPPLMDPAFPALTWHPALC